MRVQCPRCTRFFDDLYRTWVCEAGHPRFGGVEPNPYPPLRVPIFGLLNVYINDMLTWVEPDESSDEPIQYFITVGDAWLLAREYADQNEGECSSMEAAVEDFCVVHWIDPKECLV